MKVKSASLNQIWVLLPLILCGCASTPVIVTQRVTVPQFVPIPINLLETPDLVFPVGSTWGQVEGIEYEGLQACRGQLQAIGKIQGTIAPPATTHGNPEK